MRNEPAVKRALAFVDGQNLFHAARSAFGYTFPNYGAGVPDTADNAHWSSFWAAKLLHLSRQGVYTFTRSLRYRNQVVNLPDGSQHAFLAAEEKGIDVRIAIDVIRMAHRNEYDVALVFSQDQDLTEVAAEIRVISLEQDRWKGPVRVCRARVRRHDQVATAHIDAPIRFLSIEPLLEDLGTFDLKGIDWAIVGGESGRKARPMKSAWIDGIKRQCDEARVKFFFKQWGTWGADGEKRSKSANGREYRNRVWDAMPALAAP